MTLEEAEAFYRELKHPAVKMMIDTVAVGVAKEKVDDWFKTFGKDIVHCHLIDGTPSGHRVFGDGEYPLLQLLRSFEENDYEGYFTMELGGTYAAVPFEADARNLRTLYRVISD